MQSRLKIMGDNADTAESVDTVETRDPEQMDRELGWITNHQLQVSQEKIIGL